MTSSRENQVFVIDMRFSDKTWTENTAMSYQPALLAFCKDVCEHYMFQLERGANGTFHFQGYLKLTTRERPTSLAMSINDKFKGIRLKASSTAGRTALSKYCMKEDTRVLGPWADTVVYLGSDLPSKLLPYQQSLCDYILGPVNNREILWIYDKHGNSGKSIWAKYMFYKHNILKLTWGDTSNMINLICKHGPQRAYIFDMSRTKPKAFSVQDLYNCLEDVKNGYVVNLKYETSTMAMDPPHVVVLANQRPDKGAVSLDRWNVVKLPSGINPYAASAAAQFDPHAAIYDVAGEPSDSEDESTNIMGDHPVRKRQRLHPPATIIVPTRTPPSSPAPYISNRKLLLPRGKRGIPSSDSDTDIAY